MSQHAVLIQCHKHTAALEYTIKKMSADSRVKIYIHVDAKVDAKFIVQFLSGNVKLTSERVDVRWGHISQFRATVILVKEALADGFKYASLISGEDIFTRSVTEFLDFLDKGTNVEYFGVDLTDLDPAFRLRIAYPKFFFRKERGLFLRLWIKLYLLLARLGLFKSAAEGVFSRVRKGSCWFTLSEECLRSVVEYVDKNKELLSLLEKSFCADEVVLQSVLLELGYEKWRYIPSGYYDDNAAALRYVDWTGPDYPKLLTDSDFPFISNSECFFARKISPSVTGESMRQFFGE